MPVTKTHVMRRLAQLNGPCVFHHCAEKITPIDVATPLGV